HVGGSARVRSARLHAEDDDDAVRAGGRRARRNGCACVFDRAAAGVVEASGEGRTGRRAVAAALRQAGRRARARAAIATQEIVITDRSTIGEAQTPMAVNAES